MTYTLTGTLSRNVITLDEDVPALARRPAAKGHRVEVAFQLLPKEVTEDGTRRETRRLLAEINDALAEGPDPEEKKLRDQMRRRLRRRNHEWCPT
jgi:hypothetical protein